MALALCCPLLSLAQPAYPPAPPAKENINLVEWFIDADPGFGHGAALPHAASTDLPGLIGNISLTGVRPGVHRLFIRSQDQGGSWSFTNNIVFENFRPDYTPPPVAPAVITELEVFFDNDPGFGKGFLQTITPGTDLSNLPLSLGVDTLMTGAHQLFVRSLAGGAWSFSGIASFGKDVPLPLTWAYVQGEIVNDQSLIKWGTLQESNTLRFEIEHSSDGIAYAKAGSIMAAGNSHSAQNYQWTHTSPSAGMNYYRIKQVDIDGQYTYSGIIALLYRKGFTRTIAAPNPVTRDLVLLFPAPAPSTVVSVYNAAGQLVLAGKVNQGAWQQRMDFSPLPKGIYTLQLNSARGVETLRILKQ